MKMGLKFFITADLDPEFSGIILIALCRYYKKKFKIPTFSIFKEYK
jgi:hypothetical protein